MRDGQTSATNSQDIANLLADRFDREFAHTLGIAGVLMPPIQPHSEVQDFTFEAHLTT